MPAIKNHSVLFLFITVLANVVFADVQRDPNYSAFYQGLDKKSDEEATQIGQKIFEQIEGKYRANTEFMSLKSKMTSADFLANQMIAQLKNATIRQMFTVAGGLFEKKSKNEKSNLLSVAPAKSFYETSLEIFSKPVSIEQLSDEEKKFLTKFYDLKLRVLTSLIAKAGQALTIAEPAFEGTYDYVLVLPLLHASESNPVNMDVLPKWMRQSQHLDIFSKSCLFHYGSAYHAQSFARLEADLEKKEFSQENFYTEASKKCAKQLPHVAVDCLKRAIDLINDTKIDERINLQFDIVQIWLDSGDFILAASEAKKIVDSYPNHKKYGNAIWLYYYAFSRANNAETILGSIDSAITDPRCSDYKAKLMYIKWWALRRQRGQSALIAVLEHQLITEYNNDDIIAPIMLSQATDLLAKQDYSEALAILDQLQGKFPSTKAAKQAKKIAEKLKTVGGLQRK